MYDNGQVRKDILEFITDCLYPIMMTDEKKVFTFRVIGEFLSKSETTFSQKSVLESLNILGVPEGELISYMI